VSIRTEAARGRENFIFIEDLLLRDLRCSDIYKTMQVHL
jgi:hypothetical protein